MESTIDKALKVALSTQDPLAMNRAMQGEAEKLSNSFLNSAKDIQKKGLMDQRYSQKPKKR